MLDTSFSKANKLLLFFGLLVTACTRSGIHSPMPVGFESLRIGMSIVDMINIITSNPNWSKKLYLHFQGPRDFGYHKKELPAEPKQIIDELNKAQSVLRAIEISSSSPQREIDSNIKSINEYNDFRLVFKPVDSFKTITVSLAGGHLSNVDFEILGRSQEKYEEIKQKANARFNAKCKETNDGNPNLCSIDYNCILKLCNQKLEYKISWMDCIDGTGGVSITISENPTEDCNQRSSATPEL